MLNKDKNPSSLQEDGAVIKVREHDPQTPLSPANITFHVTGLPKNLRVAIHLSLSALLIQSVL